MSLIYSKTSSYYYGYRKPSRTSKNIGEQGDPIDITSKARNNSLRTSGCTIDN